MEHPDELRALSRLAADELGGGTAGIGAVHGAIAGRVFGALGPTARPVRLFHDAVARGAYASVRGGASLAAAPPTRRCAAATPAARSRRPRAARSRSPC
jgi:carbohydrate-binding DOMON domain-containing protein